MNSNNTGSPDILTRKVPSQQGTQLTNIQPNPNQGNSRTTLDQPNAGQQGHPGAPTGQSGQPLQMMAGQPMMMQNGRPVMMQNGQPMMGQPNMGRGAMGFNQPMNGGFAQPQQQQQFGFK